MINTALKIKKVSNGFIAQADDSHGASKVFVHENAEDVGKKFMAAVTGIISEMKPGDEVVLKIGLER